MKKTVRVIVTYKCNRECESCCNKFLSNIPEIQFEDLLQYEEIVVTGGEPMLFAPRVVEMIHRLRANGFTGKIWLYTATFKSDHWAHKTLIREVDGITYTFHNEYSNKDISMLTKLTEFLNKEGLSGNYRLMIDSRVINDIPLNDIDDVSKWSNIKALTWKDEECPVPDNEDLVFYDLESA